jgi:hypothetical protein
MSPDFLSQHDAIMSRLEYYQNKDGKLHYYPKDVFERRLPTFNELKILYAKKHPKKGLHGKQLEDVLKEIDGRVVGFTSNSVINNSGSDFLKTTYNITDPSTDLKIKNRELSHSLGFRYSAPDVGSFNDVFGDHVLLYDKSLGIPQGDPGALILNQGSPDGDSIGYLAGAFKMTDEPNTLTEILGLLKQNQEDSNSKVLESEKMILKLNQDLTTEKDSVIKLNQVMDDKDKIILSLKEEIATLKKQMMDAKASRIKSNQDSYWTGLPKGIQEKFEARKDELSDPEMMFKLNQDISSAILAIPKPEFKDAEGNPDAKPGVKNNQDAEDAAETAWQSSNVRL